MLCAALGNPAMGAAQSVGNDLRTMGGDAWHIVSAPASASGSDLATAGAIAAGTTSLALLADESIHTWIHGDPFIVRLLGVFGEDSPVNLVGRTGFFLVPLSVTLYGAGHAFHSRNLRDAGMGCMTSNLTTTLSRTTIARLVGRLRPQEEQGPFKFELFAFGPWEQRSFPAGHASNAMSCASYFNHRFDLGIAAAPVYALASGVGIARIMDEAHWTSDTFAGMAYGYAVGRNVALRHLGRVSELESNSAATRVGFTIRIAF